MPIVSRWRLKMRGDIGSESVIRRFLRMPLLTTELLKKNKKQQKQYCRRSYSEVITLHKQTDESGGGGEQSALASAAQKESLLPVCLFPSRGRLHLGLCILDTGAGIAQGSSEGFPLFPAVVPTGYLLPKLHEPLPGARI